MGDNWFLSECYMFEDGLKVGEYFFVEGKDWFDVIYVNGDEVVVGVMYYVKKFGLCVLEDVVILG